MTVGSKVDYLIDVMVGVEKIPLFRISICITPIPDLNAGTLTIKQGPTCIVWSDQNPLVVILIAHVSISSRFTNFTYQKS